MQQTGTGGSQTGGIRGYLSPQNAGNGRSRKDTPSKEGTRSGPQRMKGGEKARGRGTLEAGVSKAMSSREGMDWRLTAANTAQGASLEASGDTTTTGKEAPNTAERSPVTRESGLEKRKMLEQKMEEMKKMLLQMQEEQVKWNSYEKGNLRVIFQQLKEMEEERRWMHEKLERVTREKKRAEAMLQEYMTSKQTDEIPIIQKDNILIQTEDEKKEEAIRKAIENMKREKVTYEMIMRRTAQQLEEKRMEPFNREMKMEWKLLE